MKKIDLGQTITILANLGVIAGIVFLAVELRQNNALLEAEAGYALLQNQISHHTVLRSSREFASLLAKLESGDELSPAEQYQEIGYYQILLTNWEWEFREYESGRLDEGQLPVRAWADVMSGEGPLPSPNFMDFWESRRGRLDERFVEYLETRVVPSL